MYHKKRKQFDSDQINDQFRGSAEENQSHFDSNYHAQIKRNNINQSRSRQRVKQRTRVKSEYWDYSEIRKIFTLYSQHGSQWKVMQSYFADRTANSIKNRFYTVIRTFLKLMFRYHPAIIDKLPHEIASKLILKFFEARQQFEMFQDFGKKVMKTIDYNLDSPELRKIVEQNQPLVLALYNLIFDVKPEDEQGKQPQQRQQEPFNKRNLEKKYKSEGNCSIQKIQQEQSQRISPKSFPIDLQKSKVDIAQNIETENQINSVHNQYGGYVIFVPILSYQQNPLTYQFMNYF